MYEKRNKAKKASRKKRFAFLCVRNYNPVFDS